MKWGCHHGRTNEQGKIGLLSQWAAEMSNFQTSQELQMLSRLLSDCKLLLLNVMIQVLQIVQPGGDWPSWCYAHMI